MHVLQVCMWQRSVWLSSVTDNKPGTKQTGSNQLVLIKDAPATSKFQMCHNIISPADETWERLEIVLRFSHPGVIDSSLVPANLLDSLQRASARDCNSRQQQSWRRITTWRGSVKYTATSHCRNYGSM